VVLSFRALLARVHLNRAAMGATSQMRTLLTLPTSFGHGLIGNALTPLLSGGEIVLHATGLALAQNLARIIDEYRIGFLSSVPSRAQLDSLRQIWFAGSVPTRVLLEAAMTYLCNNILCRYAASETGLIAQASARELLVKPGLVGRIVPGVEVAIFDAAGVRCLPGKAGVIKVRADSYDGTISHDQTHWVDLGDIGWIDEDNKLYVLGRSADLSVMQADFSPLYEIEHTLRLEWDLADAAAVLVKDAAGDAGPQLWIGVVDNKGATAEKLAAILRRRGLSYDVKLFDVQIIPRGANGKVNRQQLELLLRNAAHLNIG
jgi:oxalate---CoA ligase